MKKIVVILILLICINLVGSSPALIDNLISYWKLDESSGNAIDVHGDNDGTITGATQNVTGKINTAYSFTANPDDIVDISNPANLQIGTGTISVWVNSDGATNVFNSIVSKTFAYAVGTRYEAGTDKIGFYDWGGSAWRTTAQTLETGAWHHIVITFDAASDAEIWYDNVSLGTYAQSVSAQTSEIWIGATPAPASDEGFDGDIDEVGIWSRVLTDAEIGELYNSGAGLAYPFVVDTCTCPGAGNNWEIDMSDNCQIDDDCDLTTGTLSFTGAGYCNCNASVDTTNLGDPGASGILYIQDSCIITID